MCKIFVLAQRKPHAIQYQISGILLYQANLRTTETAIDMRCVGCKWLDFPCSEWKKVHAQAEKMLSHLSFIWSTLTWSNSEVIDRATQTDGKNWMKTKTISSCSRELLLSMLFDSTLYAIAEHIKKIAINFWTTKISCSFVVDGSKHGRKELLCFCVFNGHVMAIENPACTIQPMKRVYLPFIMNLLKCKIGCFVSSH